MVSRRTTDGYGIPCKFTQEKGEAEGVSEKLEPLNKQMFICSNMKNMLSTYSPLAS
jgi:hypothetical protein